MYVKSETESNKLVHKIINDFYSILIKVFFRSVKGKKKIKMTKTSQLHILH